MAALQDKKQHMAAAARRKIARGAALSLVLHTIAVAVARQIPSSPEGENTIFWVTINREKPAPNVENSPRKPASPRPVRQPAPNRREQDSVRRTTITKRQSASKTPFQTALTAPNRPKRGGPGGPRPGKKAAVGNTFVPSFGSANTGVEETPAFQPGTAAESARSGRGAGTPDGHENGSPFFASRPGVLNNDNEDPRPLRTNIGDFADGGDAETPETPTRSTSRRTGRPRGGEEREADLPTPIATPTQKPVATPIPRPTATPAPKEEPKIEPKALEPDKRPEPVAEAFRRPALRYKVAPDYPANARAAQQEGVTLLRLSVSAGGDVTGAEVISSSGSPSLDAAAARCVRRWKYDRASRDWSTTGKVTFRLTN